MTSEDRKTVVLAGDIDHYSAAVLCRVLDAIDGPAVVDLAHVRLLTAAGLNELAKVAQRVGARTVTLSGASLFVFRLLELVEFEKLFIIDSAGPPPKRVTRRRS